MMEFFKFTKWWWRKQSDSFKNFLYFVSWVIITVASCYFIGIKGIWILLGSVILWAIYNVATEIYSSIKKQWFDYQVDKEVVAESIMARLRDPEFDNDTVERIRTQIRRGKSAPMK